MTSRTAGGSFERRAFLNHSLPQLPGLDQAIEEKRVMAEEVVGLALACRLLYLDLIIPKGISYAPGLFHRFLVNHPARLFHLHAIYHSVIGR